ncbi:MAG: hypothetical protein QNJ62_05925 [Methyloceanibacter sp.]|nr:hypothetical protein [Methyloceanibacter sp.]
MTKLHPMAVTLLVVAIIVPYGMAHAEPLEAEECKALKSQQKTLLTPTVKAALRLGPDWVKDNLHNHEMIERVREYLSVEEKVAFRCRTNGVRIPKPLPPSLPDRKPAVPTFVVAGLDATSLMPLRNPSREAGDAVLSAIGVSEGEGEGDIDDGADAVSGADPAAESAAAGVDAIREAIAKDEAAIRQGLAKP